ncbi:MAG: hypothetical protein ACOVQ5_00505 [Flavobacteriales bacterium]|jgi:hypothetical protein
MLLVLSILLTIGHGQSDDSVLALIFLWLLSIPITLVLSIILQSYNERWLRILTLILLIISGPIWVIAFAIHLYSGIAILISTAVSIFLLIRAHGKRIRS